MKHRRRATVFLLTLLVIIATISYCFRTQKLSDVIYFDEEDSVEELSIEIRQDNSQELYC